MDSGQLTKQMIGFQKTAFNHTFDIFMAMQDQTGKMACTWCEKNGFIPEQTKSAMTQWRDTFRQNLEDCKKLVNESLDNLESFFQAPFISLKPEAAGREPGKPEKAEAKKEMPKRAEAA